MTDCVVEKNNNETILHLSGELQIEYAAQLRSLLADSLREADLVKIDLSSVTAADISCLQLFCAAHKTSLAANKLLDLIGIPSTAFKDLARRTGCIRSSGCNPDKGTSCLWSEEKYYG
ncbi:MAG TPA: STAS domain-containing protein [Syntrophorhabdaceae bacterium]|nr:STAS domain-containing protein [Syntrophorhabdaceae bacterium]